MLHAWKKYGEVAAETTFHAQFDRSNGRSTRQPPRFSNVVRGKLEYLAMVKGRSDRVYVNLLTRARRIDDIFYEHPIMDDAVWVLYGDAIGMSQGTGFLLQGYGLVSCEHVVRDSPRIFKARNENHYFEPTVRAMNADIDLAVFDVQVPRPHFLPIGDPRSLRRGDKITIMGFPRYFLGQSVQLTPGVVTGFRPFHGINRISVSAPIVPGNSGGPVVNERGEVIGVAVTGSDADPPTIEYGVVPIDALRQVV